MGKRESRERIEALFRIIVCIVTGVILSLWKILIFVLAIIHWIIVIIEGKRVRSISEFSEIWNTQVYDFLRYINFVSNKRPFPFSPLEKSISKFERK